MSQAALDAAFSAADFTLAIARSALPCLDARAPDDCRNVATRYSSLNLDGELEKLRMRDDPNPEVGELIEGIATNGGTSSADYERVHAFYKLLARQRYLRVTEFSKMPYYAKLANVAATINIPNDADRLKLRRAGEFFAPRLFKITMILGTSSLLEAYACWKGVHVLSQTGQLSKFTNRRLVESWQFVMYVCNPDGFDPKRGGKAVEAIRRIRLMHGAIRWLICHDCLRKVPRLPKPTDWDTNVYGLPINGEDLLGMMLGFSRVVTRDLPKIGSSVTSERADEYRYLWDVIGEMLGVETPLRPRTVDEATQLFCAIKRRQQTKETGDGETMAKALLDFYSKLPWLDPKRQAILRFWVLALMRYLVGDFVCDLVRLPKAGAFAQLVAGQDIELLHALGAAVLGHDGVTVLKMPIKKYQIPRSLLRNFA